VVPGGSGLGQRHRILVGQLGGEAPVLDLGHHQQVVEQGAQRQGLLLHGPGRVDHLRRQPGRVPDGVGVQADHVERGAHVVDDHPRQVVAQAGGLTQLLVLPADAQHGAHARAQLDAVDRLGEKIVGPRLQRQGGVVGALQRGDQQDGDVAPALVLAQLAAQVHPAHPRHHQIGEDGGGGLGLQQLQRAGAALGLQQLVGLALQQRAQRGPRAGVVVDDQDLRLSAGRGHRASSRSCAKMPLSNRSRFTGLDW
jgi:hypothetical protein